MKQMQGKRSARQTAAVALGVTWLALVSGFVACSPAPGSFDADLQEFARLCAAGDLEEAEAAADALRGNSALLETRGTLEVLGGKVLGADGLRSARRLLTGMGLSDAQGQARGGKPDELLEGRLRWTLGAAKAQAGAVETAETDFQAVRGCADARLRELGMYGLGWLDLDMAEQLYDNIPEVKGASQNAMSPGFQAPPAGGDGEPDPLPLARMAFENALDHYLERLRADWRDADTRANVEWIQRRLRHLDEIEQERTQDEGTDRSQEDPQEQDQQEQDESESSGDQGASSDEEQEQEPQESSEESEEDQEGQEQDSESESDEETGEQDEDSEGEQDGEQQEVHLTDEQMKRLLETLLQHNQEGEELREVMQSQGRQGTDRDW